MVQLSNGKDVLTLWDQSSKKDRKKLLQNFIHFHTDLTGPELDQCLEHTAPLLLARLTASLRLTYLSISESLFEQISAVEVFLKSAGGLSFVEQFLDVGGPLALLDIIALKQTSEVAKAKALKTLQILADRGIRYKAVICESNGIKIATECLARSDNEDTRVASRELLLELGLCPASKKWGRQVYVAFIALLASKSPRANHLAIGALRVLQPVVGYVIPGIYQPLINLFDTPHLEVLLEVCVFIREILIDHKEIIEIKEDLRDQILQGIVDKLRPNLLEGQNSELIEELHLNNGTNSHSLTKNNPTPNILPIPALLGQAGCARCISMLISDTDDDNDNNVAIELLKFNVIRNLLSTAGQITSSESRRMAFKALKIYNGKFESIGKLIKAAVGSKFYFRILENEDVWCDLSEVEIDILVNNRAVVSEAEARSF